METTDTRKLEEFELFTSPNFNFLRLFWKIERFFPNYLKFTENCQFAPFTSENGLFSRKIELTYQEALNFVEVTLFFGIKKLERAYEHLKIILKNLADSGI